MERTSPDSSPHGGRLDHVETQWSLLRLAHQDSVGAAGPARSALVLRYRGAIRRYVGALMQNDQDADEVAQEALMRMLKGDFAKATPERGRFRDLLKVAVKNMVRSYWSRQQRRSTRELAAEMIEDPMTGEDSTQQQWLSAWRGSVLEMTWQALESYQRANPSTIAHTLLRLRTDHPDDDSPRLAERLSQATQRTYRADAVRQQLRRARLRFAELLVEQIAQSLSDPSPERVEAELADLELLDYVRDFLPSDWLQSGELCDQTPN